MQKNVCELFAGVGGFRLGLEPNGFDISWANQWEPNKNVQHAFNCYTNRFSSGIHSNKDIATINTKEIPNHTLLVGGFPCQDYSVARTKAEGIQGKKGVLFWEITRILKDKKTPFVLLENVDRILKSPAKQRGRDFAIILASLWKLGYGVEWRVINAAEYGFVQKRRRAFIFAFHKNTNYYKEIYHKQKREILHSEGFFCHQFPIKNEIHKRHQPNTCILEDDLIEISDNFSFQFRNTGVMIEGNVYSEETTPILIEPQNLGRILESDVDEKYYIPISKINDWKFLKDHQAFDRISKTGHKYKYTQGKMNFPDPHNLPGRTVLTSEGSKNRSSHVVEDPKTKRLRTLTPIECERLNGFPDNWTDTGMPHRARYFVMGNALVVSLIEKMSLTLSSIIDNEK